MITQNLLIYPALNPVGTCGKYSDYKVRQECFTIPILKHVWDQTNLAHIMLDIEAEKMMKKVLQPVNKVKQKYNSLQQACRLPDISWTKFHRHTYIKPQHRTAKNYIHKLYGQEIESIQQHYQSD